MLTFTQFRQIVEAEEESKDTTDDAPRPARLVVGKDGVRRWSWNYEKGHRQPWEGKLRRVHGRMVKNHVKVKGINPDASTPHPG